MDKVLITGANGGLGKILHKNLIDRFDVVTTGSHNMDVTDWEAVNDVMKSIRPKIVFHCAAIVNADLAQSDKQATYAVNVRGTENISRACKLHGSDLVFISSDYVFSGQLNRPHREDDLVDPINYYGVTKIIGEQIVRDLLPRYYIIRCSWLFGPTGNTFLQKIQSRANEPEIRVINDQIGSPTYTHHLAGAISELIESEVWGIYHITNEGFCSWADYAKEIIRLSGGKAKIIDVSSSEYKTLAERPLNSRLSKEKLYSIGIGPLPHWKDALSEFFNVYKCQRQ